ncbi:MAG: hemerythrin family protein [Sulfurovaceae bacterium]|nr:hemerythrin family protein [Sulfurovaceae bacterium]
MIDHSNLPQVAFDEMNSVHHEEATLLNTLEELLKNSPNDYDSIATCLHEIIDHTRRHFGNEERLMREVGFPAFAMHESEHIRVFNEVQRIASQWFGTKNNELLHDYFLGSMIDWLHTHIMTMDTITAQFICMSKGC